MQASGRMPRNLGLINADFEVRTLINLVRDYLRERFGPDDDYPAELLARFEEHY